MKSDASNNAAVGETGDTNLEKTEGFADSVNGVASAFSWDASLEKGDAPADSFG